MDAVKQRLDALILLLLIAESEQALQERLWISQEKMEEILREKFGI